jgi:hypothetical protein
MQLTLPLPENVQTSLMLILYRWRDGHYENTEVKNSNDTGAVVAMADVFNEMLRKF